MNEPVKPKKGWGWLQWGVVLVIILLGLGLCQHLYKYTSHMAESTMASNNCRQITMALKIWASENNGVFPDASLLPTATSNQAFRKLIQEDIIQDERIFGSKFGPFVPDGDIGTAPDFVKALQAGENHWMLIGGLRMDSLAHCPLIMENSLNAAWPPSWKKGKQSKVIRGRAWYGRSANKGHIIVGCLDNSVSFVQLMERGDALGLPDSILNPPGEQALPPLHILDIEEKK